MSSFVVSSVSVFALGYWHFRDRVLRTFNLRATVHTTAHIRRERSSLNDALRPTNLDWLYTN